MNEWSLFSERNGVDLIKAGANAASKKMKDSSVLKKIGTFFKKILTKIR